ncbi:MAG: helix-turn-helix domain-containing protein [Pirellulales bacterium]
MLKINFRFRQLLNVDKRIPNSLLAKVARHTGLHQHQVRDMLYETKKGISFDSLGRIIDYLVTVEQIPRNSVLSRLFVTTAEDFWSMIANRDTITLCAGARQDPNYGDQYVVIASDSELQARVVSSVNGVPRDPQPPADASSAEEASSSASLALAINEQLVPAPLKKPELDDQVRAVAHEEFRAFLDGRKNQALVCLGSVKSNPVIEELFAYCFRDTAPFVSQDGLANADDRTVPFMFRYRPYRDPHPPSCCGGKQLAEGSPDQGPGIYYAASPETWDFVPHNEESDAAMVFYHHEVATGRLCVVMGGFSSRGTRALAHFIRTRAGELWPPSFDNGRLQVGLFILRFSFRQTEASAPSNPLAFVPPHEHDIIVESIPEEVLRDRLPPRWLVAEKLEEDENGDFPPDDSRDESASQNHKGRSRKQASSTRRRSR